MYFGKQFENKALNYEKNLRPHYNCVPIGISS